MILRLGNVFGCVLLCSLAFGGAGAVWDRDVSGDINVIRGLEVTGDIENDTATFAASDFIEKVKSGEISAVSTEIGEMWFSDVKNRDETFNTLRKWANETEAEKLSGIKGVILPAMPEYCFDARQSFLLNHHINYLKSVEGFETYRSEMSIIQTALKTLDEDIKKCADKAAAKVEVDGLERELVYRGALSTQTEEQNDILFSYGFNEKVSDGAWYFLQEIIIGTQCEYDYDNTEWLKEQLPLIGWPSIAGHDKKVDKAAAFLVRRAYDIPFIVKMTKQLKPFYDRSEIDQSSYEKLNNAALAYQASLDRFAELVEQYPGVSIRPPRMCHRL
ncbi:hypothetical protein [Kordiimonas sp. SCSIO 12610]|uniref:hypothetical protein n=1 Tax=Kordiimonas sp. SCSIO 12610 TaxID=2829597 RepID=UPI00210E4E97|nr:hypothetical protein [Kordiimonas sp. SCSIO 12610]UTW56565.1 hypothetical protein KFF44_06605 [Kordiimonas sp. SCSIO 12610]